MTELCPGGEVYDYERFNERMAAEIMRSVLRCVHVMHSSGFAHRDLKLENILLSTRDVPIPAHQARRLRLHLPHRCRPLDAAMRCTHTRTPLSLTSGDSPHASAGTPAYWAPDRPHANEQGPCGFW